MDTNKHELILKDEVFQIVGCAMSVLNGLGHGFPEKIYENSLCVEFDEKKITYAQQQRFDIRYKERNVGLFIPDLILFGKIIVDIKTIDKIGSIERGQILNYLKVTNLELGLILNFKNPKLEWERIVL